MGTEARKNVSVKINIHPFLHHLTDGQELVEVNGSTVGQCLEQLVDRFPGTKEGLFVKNGNLASDVEVYVNGESAFPEELAKAVKDGDELHIIVMLIGG